MPVPAKFCRSLARTKHAGLLGPFTRIHSLSYSSKLPFWPEALVYCAETDQTSFACLALRLGRYEEVLKPAVAIRVRKGKEDKVLRGVVMTARRIVWPIDAGRAH